MARSVNKVIIIGNLTRDPEMKYTPNGRPVVTFGVATNRQWTVNGEQKEETEFHNVTAWGKLAEICSQILVKGRKVYIEGRLRTRNWEDQNGVRHYRTEIVASDMVVLDRRSEDASAGVAALEENAKASEEHGPGASPKEKVAETPKGKDSKKGSNGGKGKQDEEDIELDAIPF